MVTGTAMVGLCGVPARHWPVWHIRHHLAVDATVFLSSTVPGSRQARGCQAQEACCCFVPFLNSSGMSELPSELPVRPCSSVQPSAVAWLIGCCLNGCN